VAVGRIDAVNRIKNWKLIQICSGMAVTIYGHPCGWTSCI